MSAHKGHRGFTIIELLIAVTIVIALALAAATLFASVLKLQVRDKLTQDLQREADAVSEHMSRNLKQAVSVDTVNSNFTTNPNTLTVKLENNQSRKYFVTGSQVHYVNESGTDENLQAPGSTTTSLTFEQSTANQVLQQIKIRGTLRRARGNTVITVDFGTSVSPRPQ